jgi:hypothetical protein
MFVGSDVVEDRVDRLAGRDGGLDGVEEPDELTVPVALHATAEHGTRQDIKGSKQCRRAVTGVVMGLGGRMAGGEWPVEAGPLQRLDLALLIDGQHHRMGRRILCCGRRHPRPWRRKRDRASA